MTTFYTLKKQVPLKPGQTIGFKEHHGYYAKPLPVRKPKPAAKKAVAKPPVKPAGLLIRNRMVMCELALAKLGIRETGGNNHGPWVKKFLASVGLPEGFPWCDAFQSYVEEQVAKKKLAVSSASVGATYAAAKKNGWVVTRPLRGDLACYDFDGDGQFNDHIELVVKVLGLGPMLTLQVVGGNTSSGVSGSQADGDGVWLRRRVIARSRVGFVRIPGSVPA